MSNENSRQSLSSEDYMKDVQRALGLFSTGYIESQELVKLEKEWSEKIPEYMNEYREVMRQFDTILSTLSSLRKQSLQDTRQRKEKQDPSTEVSKDSSDEVSDDSDLC